MPTRLPLRALHHGLPRVSQARLPRAAASHRALPMTESSSLLAPSFPHRPAAFGASTRCAGLPTGHLQDALYSAQKVADRRLRCARHMPRGAISRLHTPASYSCSREPVVRMHHHCIVRPIGAMDIERRRAQPTSRKRAPSANNAAARITCLDDYSSFKSWGFSSSRAAAPPPTMSQIIAIFIHSAQQPLFILRRAPCRLFDFLRLPSFRLPSRPFRYVRSSTVYGQMHLYVAGILDQIDALPGASSRLLLDVYITRCARPGYYHYHHYHLLHAFARDDAITAARGAQGESASILPRCRHIRMPQPFYLHTIQSPRHFHR